MTIDLLSLMLGSLRSLTASPTRDSYRALVRDCLHRILSSDRSDPLALLGRVLTSSILPFYHHQHNRHNSNKAASLTSSSSSSSQPPPPLTVLESVLDFCSFPPFHELILLARLIECIDATSLLSSPTVYDVSKHESVDGEDGVNDDDRNDIAATMRDFCITRFKAVYERERANEGEGERRAGLFRSRGRYTLFVGYLEQFMALDEELDTLSSLSHPTLSGGSLDSLPALCLDDTLDHRPQCMALGVPVLKTGEVVCEMGPVSCCSSVENFRKSMFLNSNTGSPKTLSEDDVARVLNYIIL